MECGTDFNICTHCEKGKSLQDDQSSCKPSKNLYSVSIYIYIYIVTGYTGYTPDCKRESDASCDLCHSRFVQGKDCNLGTIGYTEHEYDPNDSTFLTKRQLGKATRLYTDIYIYIYSHDIRSKF